MQPFMLQMSFGRIVKTSRDLGRALKKSIELRLVTSMGVVSSQRTKMGVGCDSGCMFSTKPRVLLVDDEASIHFMMGLFLRQAGYFVDDAKDGVEALHKFKEGSWDVVITDLTMPEMGGEDLAAEIRMLTSNTPIILITGFLKSETREDLFDEVLEKPFSKANLLAAMERALAGALRH